MVDLGWRRDTLSGDTTGEENMEESEGDEVNESVQGGHAGSPSLTSMLPPYVI